VLNTRTVLLNDPLPMVRYRFSFFLRVIFNREGPSLQGLSEPGVRPLFRQLRSTQIAHSSLREVLTLPRRCLQGTGLSWAGTQWESTRTSCLQYGGAWSDPRRAITLSDGRRQESGARGGGTGTFFTAAMRRARSLSEIDFGERKIN